MRLRRGNDQKSPVFIDAYELFVWTSCKGSSSLIWMTSTAILSKVRSKKIPPAIGVTVAVEVGVEVGLG